MSPYLQVVTTTETADQAEQIARALVERRLAACVQIVGPIRSIYRWQGQIESAQEWQCWIKTRAERFEAVRAAIVGLHTYQVPEILALPVEAGHGPYLAWLDEQLSG
jgi:periplasmic divalent cation tolerance protein